MLLDNSFVSDTRVEKEVEVLLSNFNAAITVLAIHDPALPEIEKKNGYTIERVIDSIVKHPLKKGYVKTLSYLIDILANRNFDILHCHDYHMLFIGTKIKKLKPQIKLIYDSHEYLRGWPLYLGNKGFLNQLKGYIVWRKELMLEKNAVKYADEVITVTNSIADLLKVDLNLKRKPTVLNNYPPVINSNKNESLKREFNISEGKKVLIHSGSIYYSDRQLNQLFEIIKKNEDIVLVFIGNRPRFFEVNNLAEKNLSLKNKVFFKSYPANYITLFSIISSADIGLMHIRNKWLAHKFGAANKFMEYSHAGLAIISTHQNTAMEINKTYGHCNFYDENSFSEFKEALNNTLQNIDMLKAKAVQIKNKLNWESESKKLIDLYSKIISI